MTTETQALTDKSEMRTIPQTAARYRDNGISERAVRRWVQEGAFPVVRAGVKVLINQSIFERYLMGELQNSGQR